MAIDDLPERKRLTFAQAEGASALPTQLDRTEMPRTLRARLWNVLHQLLENSAPLQSGYRYLKDPWLGIIKNEFIVRSGGFVETFSTSFDGNVKRLSKIFSDGSYIVIFDFLQFVLRQRSCPPQLHMILNSILESECSAYRIVDRDTFVPIGSEQEASAIRDALKDTSTPPFAGAHTHLRQAAEFLTNRRFADSVRESIHAVEAVARTLEPSAELSKALARLETSANLHGAMKRGLTALYGYTSDEGGIRHALLDAGDANVDETDAIFMIGACASFVTYLIAKKRAAGITTQQ